jgi:hypothetical protein
MDTSNIDYNLSQSSDVKMPVFCLTYQNSMSVMSVWLATQKVIVLIVNLSVDLVSSEILIVSISEIPRVLE